MAKMKMEFPEVAGKTVEAVVLHDDPVYGREVTLTFSDGMELSIAICVQQNAEARYFMRNSGDAVFERFDTEAPEPRVEL